MSLFPLMDAVGVCGTGDLPHLSSFQASRYICWVPKSSIVQTTCICILTAHVGTFAKLDADSCMVQDLQGQMDSQDFEIRRLKKKLGEVTSYICKSKPQCHPLSSLTDLHAGYSFAFDIDTYLACQYLQQDVEDDWTTTKLQAWWPIVRDSNLGYHCQSGKSFLDGLRTNTDMCEYSEDSINGTLFAQSWSVSLT